MGIREAKTVFDFDLRVGLRVGEGRVVRHGRMRPATALDELEVLEDFRVFVDPGSITPLLLARCIEFDGVDQVRPSTLDCLTLLDLRLLEDLYRRINGYPPRRVREQNELHNKNEIAGSW